MNFYSPPTTLIRETNGSTCSSISLRHCFELRSANCEPPNEPSAGLITPICDTLGKPSNSNIFFFDSRDEFDRDRGNGLWQRFYDTVGASRTISRAINRDSSSSQRERCRTYGSMPGTGDWSPWSWYSSWSLTVNTVHVLRKREARWQTREQRALERRTGRLLRKRKRERAEPAWLWLLNNTRSTRQPRNDWLSSRCVDRSSKSNRIQYGAACTELPSRRTASLRSTPLRSASRRLSWPYFAMYRTGPHSTHTCPAPHGPRQSVKRGVNNRPWQGAAGTRGKGCTPRSFSFSMREKGQDVWIELEAALQKERIRNAVVV